VNKNKMRKPLAMGNWARNKSKGNQRPEEKGKMQQLGHVDKTTYKI